MELIGRKREQKVLSSLFDSNKPEFLALYGRRRIGKTFLIRQFFKNKESIFFYVTGTKRGKLNEQITHFSKQISQIFLHGFEIKPPKNWDEAFDILTKAIAQLPKNQKIVLFFDELPWMATPKSRLLHTLDYYWNQFWSDDPRIKLIICGSAASWIIQKIIKNKDGLYNRITEKIYLEPFNLSETKIYLQHTGTQLTHQHLLLLYMVTGGVPYYLSKIKKGKSATQIIEEIAYSKDAFLITEFDELFASLFNDGDTHIEIVKLLANNREGIGKRKLLEAIGKSALGNSGLTKLRELEETGFIMSFKPLFHKKGVYYRLIDEYTLFYLKWIEPIRDNLQRQNLDPGNWQAIQNTPQWYSWLGYAFESVCYKHIANIKKTLSIPPGAKVSSWRYVPRKAAKEKGAQIDLLFDRLDDTISLCEMKYTEEPFVLTKEYVEELNRKITVFKEQTLTKKQLFFSLISAQGLKNNYYAEHLITGLVQLDDLFE